MTSAKKLIEAASSEARLTREIGLLRSEKARLIAALDQQQALSKRSVKPKKLLKPPPTGASFTRVIIPDSHGSHIDWAAANACLADIKILNPKEIILLGDHLDCSGTFNAHQRTYTNEMTESYEHDVAEADMFIQGIRYAAPNAGIRYLEGNHEQHVERWAARNFTVRRDAEMLLSKFGPEAVLKLKEREISYHKRSVFYDGLSIPGAIRRGKCVFVHGISHSKHATYHHLIRVGTNVVHGHTHRVQSAVERTVTSDGFGAWCPGTLAKLQPLYKHTEPSSWAHGYAVQFVQVSSGRFLHFNVAIQNGVSLLNIVADRLR